MSEFQQGGDAQAISRIAKSYYSGFRQMFDAHGWEAPGDKLMVLAPSLIVQEYGSIKEFEKAHEPSGIMSPLEAINSDPPNVWLTSFYGFNPELWGMLGFSNDGHRKRFIRETRPGALVVIYGHKSKAPEHQRGMVIGVQQVSHSVNHAKAYISPVEWQRKEADSERADKWNLAVKAIRAWRVAPEFYMPIEDFAPDTYSLARAQAIGSQGARLAPGEAQRILDLTLIETSVFGELPIESEVAALGREILFPSRPGPVSQSGYFCKEAEGPKSLYVLRLVGDESAFLGRDVSGKWIVKVGFSKSPLSRCESLNRALPAGAFKWEVLQSNETKNLAQFPSSRTAVRAETAMKDYLAREQQSLGGEFFLTDRKAINDAWEKGMEAISYERT